MNLIIIALIWTAYCALHSYLISISFTRFIKNILNSYYAFYRLFYVLISFVLLVPVFHYTSLLQTDVIFTYHPPWSVIRIGVLVVSLLIFVKAFFIDYDSLQFLGLRQILNFGRTRAENTNGIKKTGLLGIVRHPLYFAVILALWCNTYRISDIIVNSVLTIYVFIGTILEERKLVLEFGDVYNQYKKEVPMLIPFAKAFSNRKSSHPDN